MDTLRFPRPPMHALSICVVLGCFLTLSAANSVQGVYDHKPYKRLEYDKPLVLQCTIDAPSDTQYTLKWFKEDKPLEGERFKINTEENKLTVSKAGEDDIGNYTCQAVNAKTNVTEKAMRAEIQVIGLPKITMAEDTPVVEGERLRLHCSVRGYPTPKVIWLVDDKIANDSRIRYENDKNVLEAFLVIDSAQMSDRHTYTCRASNEANQELPAVEKKTFVRVKDKLAALWPFLGICAEVAVLCTIILIYEKKRNKTELDESDTDQSPEQKNTPDHGKDVRQRK